MKFLNLTIEWIIVFALGFLGPFDLFQGVLRIFLGEANLIFNIVRLLLVFLILFYQIKNYGIKIIHKPFIFFFLLYSLYIFLDLTLFWDRSLIRADENYPISTFFIKTILIITLFLCSETITLKFNCYKFLFLCLFFSLLPAIFYIQYFGSEALQLSRSYVNETDRLPFLNLGYAGAIVFILSCLALKKVKKKTWLAFVSIIPVASIAGYVTIISGERGPIVWGLISLWICFLITSKQISVNILIVGFTVFFLYINIDFIIDILTEFAPKTAQKIYLTVYENNTSGRYEAGKTSGSLYGDAINQFWSSPLIGSYFRLTRDFSPKYCGLYPHNVILEMLITMGLLGFIPFITLIIKGFVNFRKMVKKECTLSMISCFALFLFSFFKLFTSGTIVLDIEFWLYFYILCIIPQFYKKSLENFINE